MRPCVPLCDLFFPSPPPPTAPFHTNGPSEAAYNDQRDATLARMLVVFEEAGHRLDFILMRTMQYQKQVLEDSLRTIKPWDAIVPGLLKQAKEVLQ